MEVTRKDGIMLLREIATEVKNFMDFKMNAVMVSTLPLFTFSLSLFYVFVCLLNVNKTETTGSLKSGDDWSVERWRRLVNSF